MKGKLLTRNLRWHMRTIQAFRDMGRIFGRFGSGLRIPKNERISRLKGLIPRISA